MNCVWAMGKPRMVGGQIHERRCNRIANKSLLCPDHELELKFRRCTWRSWG